MVSRRWRAHTRAYAPFQATGHIRFPVVTDEAKFAFIAASDVGEMAAAALLAKASDLKQFQNKQVELHGPEMLSFDEVVASIAKQAGYPLECKTISADHFANDLAKRADWNRLEADSYTHTFVELTDRVQARKYAQVTDPAFDKLFGRPETTFSKFLTRGLANAFKRPQVVN